MENSNKENLRNILEKHRDELMEVNGVAGVGEGQRNGKPCIRVFVIKKSLEVSREIPSTLGGYAVEIEETGAFQAL